MIKVKKYHEELKIQWDTFIDRADNSTFLFKRDFMEYHSDRFTDFSLLFFKSEKLIAVLPGNIKNETVYSHQGLTYGGLVYSRNTSSSVVLEIFNALYLYLGQSNIKRLIYKCIPEVYHKSIVQNDLYALFRNDFELRRRDLSIAIDLELPIKMSRDRRYRTNKSKKNNLKVGSSKEFEVYMDIVNENLEDKFKISAVHKAQELSLLSQNFPENIKLYTVRNSENSIIGGTLLFIDNHFIHTQYLHANNLGKRLNSTEFLVDYLINHYKDKKYLIFGVSTENNGRVLNTGLTSFKEGFGGSGIVHDFYEKLIVI